MYWPKVTEDGMVTPWSLRVLDKMAEGESEGGMAIGMPRGGGVRNSIGSESE